MSIDKSCTTLAVLLLAGSVMFTVIIKCLELFTTHDFDFCVKLDGSRKKTMISLRFLISCSVHHSLIHNYFYIYLYAFKNKKIEAFLISQAVFLEPVLNGLMSLSRPHWLEARKTIADLLSADNPRLRDNAELRAACLVPQAAATMHLPATIGDYTDFYSSIGRAQGRDPLSH